MQKNVEIITKNEMSPWEKLLIYFGKRRRLGNRNLLINKLAFIWNAHVITPNS